MLIGGESFIFSILHPCLMTPESGWEKTSDGDKLHWNVDKYFFEGVYEQRLGDREKILYFHRTLSRYINSIIKTGFTLEEVVGPKPSEDILNKYHSFRRRLQVL